MWTLHEFASPDAMTEACAEAVLVRLQSALDELGQASLAVSGGSSPKPLYERLSGEKLDWADVSVALVDERWVNPGEAGSNETFVRQTLLQNYADDARFVGLKTDGATPADGLAAAMAALSDVPVPFDAVILGLGPDGHTASWFPHAAGLADALAPGAPLLAAVTAHASPVTGAHLQRITLTKAALKGARHLALMISGDAKAEALARALEPGPVEELPVRALLHDDAYHLHIYQAP